MKYLIWMRETLELEAETCNRLLEHFGSGEAVYKATKKELAATGLLQSDELPLFKNKSLDDASRILARCDALGITPLAITDDAYPARLKSIYDPPVVLYVRGTLPDIDHLPTLAMVGTRRATPYGLMTAEKLGYQLSASGFVIVSGLAYGIDAASQRGACKGPMPTVSVFGTAIDECYPEANADLLAQVLQNGCALSEYPPGKQTYPSYFPRRNRIMSGLSLGTLVVEAPRRSGALITATLAIEQGRDVFAVPGDIYAKNSQGANDLIKAGTAKLVETVSDIVDDYRDLGHYLLRTPPPEREGKMPVVHTIGHALSAVPQNAPSPKAAIPAQPSDDPVLAALQGVMALDDVVQASGLPAAEVSTRLTKLELSGQVRRLPGNLFEKTQQA